mgnify:CR=1 FL=1
MGTLKELLSADRFAAEAGVELLEISPGYAKARMKVTEKHLNAGGVCQVRCSHWLTWLSPRWQTAEGG